MTVIEALEQISPTLVLVNLVEYYRLLSGVQTSLEE